MSSDRWSDEPTTRGSAAPKARTLSPRLTFLFAIGLCSVATSLFSSPLRAGEFAATDEEAIAVEGLPHSVDTELSAEEAAAVEREEEAAAFAGERSAAAATDRLEVDAVSTTKTLEAESIPQSGDELWMVSARRAKIVAGEAAGLDYWRYADGRWNKATLEDLTAADAAIPTCFHVHGNRVSLCEANAGGWHYYTTLTTAGCRERGPLRWVIFTWPSDRLDCGPRKDVQIKAVRSECYGFYLAWLVDRLSPDAHVSMLGYSFGTRLIGSSLHYLGGGSLRGRKLNEVRVENRHVRTVLLAAALDNNHFSPGHTMQMAPTQIDRLLLGLNPSDPALKWYALLYQITFRPRRGQQALGHSGVAGLSCSALNGRVEQRNMQCAVGREHDTHGYHYLTPGFVERMRTYVYFEDVTAK